MLLKGTRTGVLTCMALDYLFAQDNCCPYCCGACWVLQDMMGEGDLSKIVEQAPVSMYRESEWWNIRNWAVREDLVRAKWLTVPCDHGVVEEEEYEVDDEPDAALLGSRQPDNL